MNKVLLLLVAVTIFNIARYIKANNDCNQFTDFHSSLGGTIVDAARGYEAGAQGDPLGPALDLVDQSNDLADARSNAIFWTWISIGGTVIFYLMTAKRKSTG